MGEPEHVIPFTFEGHLIVVDGQVRNLPGRFIVDTGTGGLPGSE